MIVAILFFVTSAFGLEQMNSSKVVITNTLSDNYPGAWIEIHNEAEISAQLKNAKKLSFQSEDGLGHAIFKTDKSQIQVNFSAWVNAPIAIRRIGPTEKLEAKDFAEQKVDIAKGDARPYRGLILSAFTNWNEYEAKQTIPAGAFPTVTMVQRIPDAKRGDMVNVSIKQGTLHLSTTGILQEPGLIGEKVRVLTKQHKKELTGILKSKDGIEVAL